MSRAGRVWRHRAADRNLAVRHFKLPWWRAYLVDRARYPLAHRCQVNPYNRFYGPIAGQRCRILNAADRPLHHHGTEQQWTLALRQRAMALAHDTARVTTPARRVAGESSVRGDDPPVDL